MNQLNLSCIPAFLRFNIIEPFTRKIYSNDTIEDIKDYQKSFDELNLIYKKHFEFKMRSGLYEIYDKYYCDYMILIDILHIISIFQSNSSIKKEQNEIDFKNFKFDVNSVTENIPKRNLNTYDKTEHTMKLKLLWRRLNPQQRKHILNYIYFSTQF